MTKNIISSGTIHGDGLTIRTTTYEPETGEHVANTYHPNWQCEADFDVVDGRGRRIGAQVRIYEKRAGVYEVWPQSTRDGVDFGALPVRSVREFGSMSDARAYAFKWLHDAAKRRRKAAH